MMDDPRDQYLDKITQGIMTWDDLADMFRSTMVGQSSGASRELVLARMKQRFGDEAAMNTWLQTAYAYLPPALKPKPNA
jgi:hypothetical protein